MNNSWNHLHPVHRMVLCNSSLGDTNPNDFWFSFFILILKTRETTMELAYRPSFLKNHNSPSHTSGLFNLNPFASGFGCILTNCEFTIKATT